MSTINLFNVDCNEFMKDVPDKYYDLAIVDPPYGIGQDWKKNRKGNHYKHNSSYKNDKIQLFIKFFQSVSLYLMYL